MPNVDIQVSDYNIMTNATATVKSYNTQVTTAQSDITAAKTTLGDGGVLMGPFADECARVAGTLDTDLSGIVSELQQTTSFIGKAEADYKTADAAANNTISDKTGTGPTSTSSANAISSGTMVPYQFNGKNFNVVNTKISLDDYTAYINKNKMTQNGGLLGGDCMLLSQYYAADMLSGKYTSRSAMANCQGAPAPRMNEVMSTPNRDEALQYMYKELNEGHPVTLQATQVNTQKDGSRHIVTVVGYTSDVKSASDLNKDNILVLDNVDGKIQTLGQARSEGGHDRDLFAQGGKYQVKGPTEKFLATIA